MKNLMKHLFALAGCLLLTVAAVAAPIKGRVVTGGEPCVGVYVSDGVQIVRTDAEGAFALDAAEDAPYVWIITPAGYVAPYETGSPQFYLPIDGRESYDFELLPMSGEYTLLAIGDPQTKTDRQMGRLRKEIVPEWKDQIKSIRKEGRVPVMLILGDVVWDSPKLAQPMRELFSELDLPIYTVIGNHDHLIAVSDDAGSAKNYSKQFGPTYYAFDLGNTHFVAIDNIIYHGNKNYEENIDERQLQWLESYIKLLPEGSRLCITMHAPFQKYWKGTRMKCAERVLAMAKNLELHFITGHTHINSNWEVAPGVLEHNVAQVNGNLWHAPLNNDGTPKGYEIFTENEKGLEWHYKTLGKPLDYQFKLYKPGRVEGHPNAVVAKVWNWDTEWKVEWSEDGQPMGEMTRYEKTPDPDYIDHLERAKAKAESAGKRLSKAEILRPAFFYFGAEPSKKAKSVEVTVTDRFGNRYTKTLKLKK